MNAWTKDRVWRTTNLKLANHNPGNVSLACSDFKGAQSHLQISVFWNTERQSKSSCKLVKFQATISREFKV